MVSDIVLAAYLSIAGVVFLVVFFTGDHTSLDDDPAVNGLILGLLWPVIALFGLALILVAAIFWRKR